VAQLAPALPEIRAAGAELVAVGNGNVMHLNWFLEELKPDFPIFTDPSTKVYAAAGLKKGILETFGPSAALRGLKSILGGNPQKGVKGDAFQQGGAMIVLRDGTLAWTYVSEGVGDHPPNERVLSKLKSALS
jgi:hypothetical protein